MTFLLRKFMNFPKDIHLTGQNAQKSFSTIKMYVPNNLEKKFLIWTGKYKNPKDIPPMISAGVMERVRSKIRIRLANIMIISTVFGCIIMVISGKKARNEGISLTRQNLEWHYKFKEEK